MAKTTGKKSKASTGAARRSRSSGDGKVARSERAPSSNGKHLVIVESPTKAKTINKYLGSDYLVMASVGHVRDLPARNPKGVKAPVPGVDLEHDFRPTYEVLPAKRTTVANLKRASRSAADVWFATDLDREGEAIAWHLAQALDTPLSNAKRVVFNAITRNEIQNAFAHPRRIDENKVNAQQARRILDRIVGYQVSPLLWKKVAGGLSAGRVQSVAVRLVVEREREIEAFEPEEFWKIAAYFTVDANTRAGISRQWRDWLAQAPADRDWTVRDRLNWLGEHNCFRAELVEIAGQPFKVDHRDQALSIAQKLGFELERADESEDPKAKGPARQRVRFLGQLSDQPPSFAIQSLQTRTTTTRPSAPFITSSLQQAAANRLGLSLHRTMRIAQSLYEGVEIKGGEQIGLITYMRTDSTNLSPEAVRMARDYVGQQWGDQYLPDKPNVYTSRGNAQEAHEAIRPTDVTLTPQRVRSSLSPEQFKIYDLIWRRFVACQMSPAQWNATTALIATDAGGGAVFKATGRTLLFDGFYKAMGLPSGGEEAILPALQERQPLAVIDLEPTQHFTSPPPRYTEASLQKKLEEEGIGRPSTYAPIIQTIQDRQYVESVAPGDRRLRATDLGMVVTDKLVEAFPRIMDVAYTRQMEGELDKIEEEGLDWVQMLHQFYGPFRSNLDRAHDLMVHAKAETEPAPHRCAKCDAATVYRFGKNGRFLSCSRYPDCDYAAPIDREGNPVEAELSDIVCPVCGAGMSRRVGRFGPFLGCVNYPKCKGIVNLDRKKGTIVLPKPPPLTTTDLPCPKCSSPLNLRRSKRGPWLSCSTFPKCRGRVAWTSIDPAKREQLEAALAEHEARNPQPQIRTTAGAVVNENYVPRGAATDQQPATEDPDTVIGSDAA